MSRKICWKMCEWVSEWVCVSVKTSFLERARKVRVCECEDFSLLADCYIKIRGNSSWKLRAVASLDDVQELFTGQSVPTWFFSTFSPGCWLRKCEHSLTKEEKRKVSKFREFGNTQSKNKQQQKKNTSRGKFGKFSSRLALSGSFSANAPPPVCVKGHSHGRQKSSGTILHPARKTGQMGRIQQVPLERRNEPMHGPNRLQLG